jgi:hypothetical protein
MRPSRAPRDASLGERRGRLVAHAGVIEGELPSRAEERPGAGAVVPIPRAAGCLRPGAHPGCHLAGRVTRCGVVLLAVVGAGVRAAMGMLTFSFAEITVDFERSWFGLAWFGGTVQGAPVWRCTTPGDEVCPACCP